MYLFLAIYILFFRPRRNREMMVMRKRFTREFSWRDLSKRATKSSFDMHTGVEHNPLRRRRHRRRRPVTQGSVRVILLEFHYNADNAQLARRLLSFWITSRIIATVPTSSSPSPPTEFLLNVKINRMPRARTQYSSLPLKNNNSEIFSTFYNFYMVTQQKFEEGARWRNF